MDMNIRPRRLRGSQILRKMVRETRVDKSSLIYPIFVKEGENIKEEIPTMPGQYRYSLDTFPKALEELLDALESVDMESLTEQQKAQLQELVDTMELSREELAELRALEEKNAASKLDDE